MFNWDVKILSMGNIVYPGRQGGPYIWTKGEGAIYNLILQPIVLHTLPYNTKFIVPGPQYCIIKHWHVQGTY